MAIQSRQFNSPLQRAAQNIVSIERGTIGMKKTQRSFTEFLGVMKNETAILQSIKFDYKKIKKMETRNLVSENFGRPGSLLTGLLGGALDLGGFIGEFFGGKKKGKPGSGKVLPKGKGIKLGGMKALGVANALFAGLDFATGLAEGESVGKAAAGAGGSLAGSLLGGAIGQTLIPIPGVGFMIGSAVGGMAGGYLGDRTYEAVTGEGKDNTQEELRKKESEQIKKAESVSKVNWQSTIEKFDTIVYKFEAIASKGFFGKTKGDYESQADGESEEYPMEPDTPELVNNNTQSGPRGEYSVTGGFLPSSKRGSAYGPRWGRQHYGIDYPVPAGTPISVIQPGTVSFASLDSGGNLSVYIDHKDGSHTRYLHLSEVSVAEGQEIEPGTLIGKTGGEKGAYGSGNSTGPHLHYEYAPPGGGSIDPAPGNNDDNFFRFGGNIQVKPKVQSKTGAMGNPPPAKPMSENEFHSARTTSDIEDKWDDRIGGSQTYDEYLKYFEKNNGKISAPQPQNEPPKQTPEPTSSFQKRRQSRGSQYRPSQVKSDSTKSTIQQQVSQQVQQYPSYNTERETITFIPMAQGSNNSPMIISTGAGGGETIFLPGPSESQVLNSLFKTMLLTNLSST